MVDQGIRPQRPLDGPELAVAVQWWADAIEGQALHSVGSVQSDLMADWATSHVRSATPDQIEMFKRELRSAILKDDQWARTWQTADAEHNPNRGSAFRILATDYGPERHLRDALEAAGLSRLLVPMKTVMWVSPGLVRVGTGHAAPIQTLYEDKVSVL